MWINPQVYSIPRRLREVICACVVAFSLLSLPFQGISSLFPLAFPSNGTVVEIQTYVESEERCCLSHSLSLRVQLRGLVCAWVPRIMITAAEKHIFTIQEIRAGNLQAEDLTSSLWLIVELTEKSPATTNKRIRNTVGTSEKNPHCYLFPVSDISHSGMSVKSFP